MSALSTEPRSRRARSARTCTPICSGVVGVAGLMAGACSLLVDVPDLTSGRVEHAKDGSADAADTGVADAASPDACMTMGPAPFCDDFDDGPLASRWENVAISGTVVRIDGTQASSAPSSLFTQMD